MTVSSLLITLAKGGESVGSIRSNNFATSVLSESINLQFDSEGRVLISEKLLDHAKIKNNILFVGLGKTFQIWEPKNFDKFKVVARKKAYQNRSNLKWDNNLTREKI